MAVATAAGMLHSQLGTSCGGPNLNNNQITGLCAFEVQLSSFSRVSASDESIRSRLEHGTKLECALRSTSLTELAASRSVSGQQLRQKFNRRNRRGHTVCEAAASVDTRPEIEAPVNLTTPVTEASDENVQDNGGRQYFPLASVIGQVI